MNQTDKDTQIASLAQKLKLPIFATYKEYISPNSSFEDTLLNLLQIEVAEKEVKSIARKIKNASFPIIKTFELFDWTSAKKRLPHLDRAQIEELATCKYIKQYRNVIAIGNSGTGKSHTVIALGVEAIRRGYTVRFKRASELVTQMSEAQDEKQLSKYLKNLNNCHLLIIDELGYLSFDLQGASLLFQVFAQRDETKSTMITTNLEFSKWINFLGEPSLATALIDRLAHKTTFLNMNGQSYRLENANAIGINSAV